MAEYNEGRHTPQAQVRRNILAALVRGGFTDMTTVMRKSDMGTAGYPGYTFRSPQAAAFAVAKVIRLMVRDRELLQTFGRFGTGYYCTPKGVAALKSEVDEHGG